MKSLRPLVAASLACAVLMLCACRERHAPDEQADLPAHSDSATSDAAPATLAFRVPSDTLSTASESPASCSFDSIDAQHIQDRRVVDKPEAVNLKGWLSDATSNPAGEFMFILRGESSDWSVNGSTGSPRPDVSDYFDNPALGTAGFDLMADLSPLPPGEYLAILAFKVDDTLFVCNTAKSLEIQ